MHRADGRCHRAGCLWIELKRTSRLGPNCFESRDHIAFAEAVGDQAENRFSAAAPRALAGWDGGADRAPKVGWAWHSRALLGIVYAANPGPLEWYGIAKTRIELAEPAYRRARW